MSVDSEKAVIAGLFQIAIAILGSLVPIVTEFFKRRRDKSDSPSDKEKASTEKPRSLLDLAILLSYSAFLSTILTHSIIVSGRSPSYDVVVLVKSAVITFGVASVLYFAWVKGIGEKTAGALSLASLVVLLISPAGPKNPNDALEPGMPLELPIMALTFVIAIAVMYVFGSPLARDITTPRRQRVLAVLGCLAFGTAVVLGFNFVKSTIEHEKAPKFNGSEEQVKDANRSLKEIRALDLYKRGILYRFASESYLADEYRKAYLEVEADQRRVDQTFASEKRRIETNQNAGPEKEKSQSASTTAKVATTTPAVMPQLGPQPQQPASAQMPTSKPTVAPNRLVGSASTERITQLDLLTALRMHADELEEAALLKSIDDRLPFIHPAPLTPEAKQVALPLPGLDPISRYKSTSDLRTALARESDPPKSVDPSPFSIFGASDAQASTMQKRLFELRRKTAQKLLPSISENLYDRFFIMQMGLPLRDEAYVASSAAMSLLKKDDASRPLLEEFGQLTPVQQQAFVEYVAKKSGDQSAAIPEALDLLKRINDKAIDLSAFPPTRAARLRLGDVIGQPKEMPCDGIGEMTDLCTKLVEVAGPAKAADRKKLSALISAADYNGASVVPLFTKEVTQFAAHAQTFGKTDAVMEAIADPITKSLKVLIKDRSKYKTPLTEQDKYDWLDTQLTNFINLTPANRAAVLHHLAIMIYRASPPHSLHPVRVVALQAYGLSPTVAYLCATILMLPITVAAIALAAFSARKLIERDRTRLIVAAENESGQAIGDIGLPVDLLGRDNLLHRIRKLGGRGWSTIAVVGRRGIGKSRVLHEMYKPSTTDVQKPAVSVWIPAPTSYSEAEFVESVFERLALRTEQAVADDLGANALQVRLLEKAQATAGTWMFGTMVVALWTLLTIAYDPLADMMMAWLPVLVVEAIAIGAHVRFLSSVQPVDLSSWLERDRSRSASVVLLYREARAALHYLAARRGKDAELRTRLNIWIVVTISFFVGSFVAGLVIGIMSDNNSTTAETDSMFGLLAGVAAATLTGAAIRLITTTKRVAPEHTGTSVMSLTTNYRRFAATVVHHVDCGALGSRRGVLVCIDELDKVVEEEAVREFLRKMKGLFEVPGVYYYISLAEDTLARLYLTAQEKNEIDSSLDHILRVPPLTWEESRSVIRAYIKRRGFDDVDERIATVIAAVSFGVPRDIIRRCDEMLADYVGKPDGLFTIESVAGIATAVRRDRVDLACERERWPEARRKQMIGEAVEAASAIREMLGIETDERVKRLLALIWTLCACEIACSRTDGRSQQHCERIFRLGYDLPIAPIVDVLSEFDAVEKDLQAQAPSSFEPRVRIRRSEVAAAMRAMLIKRNGASSKDPHVSPG